MESHCRVLSRKMMRHSTTLKELSGFWMEVRLKRRKVDGGRTGLSLTHTI